MFILISLVVIYAIVITCIKIPQIKKNQKQEEENKRIAQENAALALENKNLQEAFKKTHVSAVEASKSFADFTSQLEIAKANQEKSLQEHWDNISALKQSEYNQFLKELEEREKFARARYEEEKVRLIGSLEAEAAEIAHSMAIETQKQINKIEIQRAKIAELKSLQHTFVEERKRREEALSQKIYHCLVLRQEDLEDVGKLRGIQNTFSRKEAIDKLIWEVYYKPAYDLLIGRLFADKKQNICGIYKITNLDNEKSYIGQSLDIPERFRQHIKAGLKRETSTNRLYQSMQQDGVENFMFEILEIVPPAKLNEREKFWIDFYQTNEYGLNSNKGG